MREAGWILLLAIATYLALILFTYSRSDPGPSFSGTGAPIANKGGAAGAWFADAFYYLFGLSAWWWVGLAVFGILRLYRRVEAWEALSRRSLAVSLVGFAFVLAASSTLEAMRMHSLTASLGFPSGGALGAVLASILEPSFGFTGSTLLLLAVIAGGLSLFTGISWLRVAESAGIGAEWVYSFARSRIEARRDREEGRIAAQVREERVEEAKHALEEHEPIRIEMPPVVIQKSERVAREKQVPLFADMPDSPLPQLSLLDQPESHFERPTAETLEYTSRLIERKLLDFNVQVKVVAAYPGPVITRYEIEPAVGVKGAQIVNLARDLARALAVTAIRVVETIPGSSYMGLEIPNPKREIVRLSEIIGSRDYADMHSRLTLALGKDITG
ncbi:MAG TPA: DNA translocase FtsK 4TM domain-containing protein, partial [Usitatibacter sp.]|nr:DNA translocase FtsK 4TM domain-containing protein [Usitatibacter sp.]